MAATTVKTKEALDANQILVRVTAAMAAGLITIVALLFLSESPSSSSQPDNLGVSAEAAS